MSEVARIVCPHGRVATFSRDATGRRWGAVLTEAQTVRDSDTGEFIEYRYAIRCSSCNSPRGITADVTEDQLNEALNALDKALPALGIVPVRGVVEVPLKLWADAVGSRRRPR